MTGKPSIIIQAGNMTGDMFGVSAALIHNPFAHVLVIKEKSDRDRSQQIISFYESSGHKEQVHCMIAEDMSEAYTKYGGRNPEALPYEKISPSIPDYLRSPSKQYPVSEATGQTASFYKKDSVGKMKEKWQVDVKVNESSCQKFLQQRNIPKNQRYAILWSRFSGKSGGPHAQHDTSFTGMRQMISIAKAGGYIVLITGDRPIKETQENKYKLMCDNSTVFDLTQFWDDQDWKELFSKGERSEQFNFFEYLNQNGGVKHLGFRSGNLEAYALLGHTVRYMEEEGNLQAGRMKAWHGGQIKYDRIMIEHPPTLTGRYVSDKAKQEKKEYKPEWITEEAVEKKQKIGDYPTDLRGFTAADLHKIHKFFNEKIDPSHTITEKGATAAPNSQIF